MLSKPLALAIAAVVCGLPLSAVSQQSEKISDGVVKVGLILDMSSLYSDITGEGSVTAARMAIEDFGGKLLGKPIELVYADHQNKADIAANKAREWFDKDKVDAILDVAASATALAVVAAVFRAHEENAQHEPGRGVFLHHALPESGEGGGYRRDRRGDEENA